MFGQCQALTRLKTPPHQCGHDSQAVTTVPWEAVRATAPRAVPAASPVPSPARQHPESSSPFPAHRELHQLTMPLAVQDCQAEPHVLVLKEAETLCQLSKCMCDPTCVSSQLNNFSK